MGITSPLLLSLSLEMCPLDTPTNLGTSVMGVSAHRSEVFFQVMQLLFTNL